MSEVVLPRRVIPQPHPLVAEGGDCGACVLGGMLGLEVLAVYEQLREGKREAMPWPFLRQALCEAKARGLVDRLVDRVPYWQVPDGRALFAAPSWELGLEWFGYVRMALDAGYYGCALVDMWAKGPLTMANHWVLICGARERKEALPSGRGAIVHSEVLVSCSAESPAGRWYGVGDLLRERGGYNLLLARPRCS